MVNKLGVICVTGTGVYIDYNPNICRVYTSTICSAMTWNNAHNNSLFIKREIAYNLVSQIVLQAYNKNVRQSTGFQCQENGVPHTSYRPQGRTPDPSANCLLVWQLPRKTQCSLVLNRRMLYSYRGEMEQDSASEVHCVVFICWWGSVPGSRSIFMQWIGSQKITHMRLPSPTKATSLDIGPLKPNFSLPGGNHFQLFQWFLLVLPLLVLRLKVLILWILDFKLQVLFVDVLFQEFGFLISFLLPCPPNYHSLYPSNIVVS